MIGIICLFFPAVLSVFFYEKVFRKDLTGKHWCYLFSFFTLAINIICFTVKNYLLHTGTAYIFSLTEGTSPQIALNYLVMAIPLAIITPLVFGFLSMHTQTKIEDNEDSVDK